MSKMARITLWLIGLGVIISISLVVGIYLISQGDSPGFVASERVLNLKFDPSIRDLPGSTDFFADPEDLPPLSTEVAQLIRDAGDDPNITGIKINLSSLSLGWAQTHEIREALVYYNSTNKPCDLFTQMVDNKSYYLASGCPNIHMAPNGIFLVTGLSVTQSYYATLFEKMDIHANFAHVGDFKSAVEPYERTGPSEAASEATDALLDSLYSQLKLSFISGRNMSESEVNSIFNDPPITPSSALEQGLIDSLSYSDEIFDTEEDTIKMSKYLRQRRKAWSSGDSAIAVIHADGAIMSGDSGESLFGGQFVGDESMTRYLRDAKEDDDVKAIVIRVNSPGGSGSASDIIWHEIEAVQEAGKTVVVSMGDYAASGGYYISMGTDYIFAQPNTITGSIGVFGGKINIKGLYDYAGVSLHTYQRGHYSTLFSEVHDFDERHRNKYQEFLEGFYDIFITKAADGRQMTKEEVHAVAQGRVWTGEQALVHGLVDELGGLEAAINKAAELENITDYRVVRYPEHKTMLEVLLDDLTESSRQDKFVMNPKLSFPKSLSGAVDHALLLDGILDGYGAAVLLPGDLRID